MKHPMSTASFDLKLVHVLCATHGAVRIPIHPFCARKLPLCRQAVPYLHLSHRSNAAALEQLQLDDFEKIGSDNTVENVGLATVFRWPGAFCSRAVSVFGAHRLST